MLATCNSMFVRWNVGKKVKSEKVNNTKEQHESESHSFLDKVQVLPVLSTIFDPFYDEKRPNSHLFLLLVAKNSRVLPIPCLTNSVNHLGTRTTIFYKGEF
jgi:hypothetical protein